MGVETRNPAAAVCDMRANPAKSARTSENLDGQSSDIASALFDKNDMSKGRSSTPAKHLISHYHCQMNRQCGSLRDTHCPTNVNILAVPDIPDVGFADPNSALAMEPSEVRTSPFRRFPDFVPSERALLGSICQY